MACRVPGCGTKAWDKKNRNRMFKPVTPEQLQEWQKVLLRFGVDDFKASDFICTLHFQETDIERERTEYKVGGEAFQVLLKRSALRHDAIPTIFPSKITRNEKERTFNRAQKLDCGTTAKEKIRFEAAQKLEYETTVKQNMILEAENENPAKGKQRKEKPMKRAVRQGESSDFMADKDSVVNPKLSKTNSVFQELLSAVATGQKLSPFLGDTCISDISQNSIRWSIWKEDLSSVEKMITLLEDLTVHVSVAGKNIVLPKFNTLVNWSDVRNLFKEVSRISPCMKSDCQSKEAEDACLGFVTKSFGQPVLRCAPCNKHQRNCRKSISANVQNLDIPIDEKEK